MPKSRLSAFLSLLLVFTSGALVGAFAHRLYMVNSVTAVKQEQRPTPEEFRKRQVAEMRDRVKLDADQVNRYNQILDKTRDEWTTLHKKMNSETRTLWDDQRAQVKAMLRPDQVPLYEQVIAEHDAQRKLHHDKK